MQINEESNVKKALKANKINQSLFQFSFLLLIFLLERSELRQIHIFNLTLIFRVLEVSQLFERTQVCEHWGAAVGSWGLCEASLNLLPDLSSRYGDKK